MKYKIIVDKQSRLNPSSEKKEYEVDIEELHCKGDIYDSLVITKDEDYVMRRLSLSKFHVLSVLDEPVKEPLQGINIELFEGDNYIYLVDMVSNKFYAEYLIKNEFNDLYVIRSEMNSAIEETARSIELSVNQKLTEYSTTEEMNALIQLLAGEIALEVSKKVGNNEVISKINMSPEAIKIIASKLEITASDVLNLLSNNTINLTSKNITISSDYLNIDEEGNMILYAPGINVFKVINPNNTNRNIYINDQFIVINSDGGDSLLDLGIINNNEGVVEVRGNGYTEIRASGITTPLLTQTSLATEKKNFEKLQNALDIIKKTDIYKYNLKNEEDGTKKHIGFIIGQDFEYAEDLTSKDNKGADIYSLASCCLQGLKEQQEQIESLQKEIKELKEAVYGKDAV